jgi:DNA-binding MarR family transcriptional regulator
MAIRKTGIQEPGKGLARGKAAAGTPSAQPSAPLKKPVREAHRQAALRALEQFRVIFRSTKKHIQWVQEATGVSGAQLWALAELHSQPGIRVTELALALAVHQSTASNLIERLEERGLIQRLRSPVDRRIVQLSLTKGGKRAISRAPMPLEGVLPNALKSLSPRELKDLRALLARLTKHMMVRDPAGKRIPLGEM